MKKDLFPFGLIMMFAVTCLPAWALPPALEGSKTDASFIGDKEEGSDDVVILGSRDILGLDDQKLVDAYVDAVVEIQATNVFHATSGFTPKQYKKYKTLLKYRLQLLLEIHRRKLEIPAEIK